MIEIKNLTKHFGEVTVLDHASLSIGSRQIVCLTGSDGTGKTTLLRLLAGVLKADSGTIVIDDMPVYDNNNIKQDIFFIPSETYFCPWAKAKDVGEYYSGVYKDFDIKLFYELLDKTGIDPGSSVHRFSDSCRKLLMLICALSSEPRFLFCDEIIESLNDEDRAFFKTLLGKALENGYLSVVLATRNVTLIKELLSEEMEASGYELKQFNLGEN